jgi:hypothetical protein
MRHDAFLIVTICVIGIVPNHVQGQKLLLKNGDAFLEATSGQQVRLTADGRTESAALSPDKKRVAMVRSVGADVSELSVFELAGEGLGRLVKTVEVVKTGEWTLPVEGDVEWSPSGRYVFFLCDFSNFRYLARLDVETGEVKGMQPVIGYSVVRSGRYQGKVIAHIRKFTLVGPWDWYWLLDENGKEVGAIGSEDSLAEFINRFCEPSQEKPRSRSLVR